MNIMFNGISNSSNVYSISYHYYNSRRDMTMFRLLICLAVIASRHGAIGLLEDLVAVMEMRRRATNVTRVNNMDLITTTTIDEQTGEERNDTIAICHLVNFVPYSAISAVNNTIQPHVNVNGALEYTAAFALALQHLNAGDGSVIAEVSGRELVDSRASAFHAVDQAIGIISRGSPLEQRPTAIIGPPDSTGAIATSYISSLKGVPQFSPQATSTELDDKGSFPLFGRLIPGDDGTAMPLLRLLVHEFGVSHFAVIHQNDAYGSKYATSIRAATRLYPNTTFVAIDLPSTGATNEDYERAVAILKGTKFRYFFAIVSSTMFEPLMNEAFRQGIAGTGKHNWIFSDSIGVGAVAREYDRGSPLHLASLGASRLSAIGGFDGVSRIYDNYLEAFKSLSQGIEILQSMQPVYPEMITERIFSSPKSTSVSIVYDTVIALGLAACNASAQTDAFNFTGKDHYDTVLESTFVGTSGNIVLNPKTGTRNASSSRFSLLNFVEDTTTSKRSNSGKVNLTSVLSKYFEGDVWLEKQQFIFNDGTIVAPRDLPEVELDSNYLGTALRAFGLTMAACVLLLSLGWALWTYKYREQRVVRASQPIFLQIICFGTFLLGSSIIPLSVDDEHSSTRGCDIACMAFPWLSSCGFCIAFSALFTKTHRVNMIFKQARFKRVKVSVMEVMVPLVALLGVNILVLSLWTGLSPFRWEREVMYDDEFGQPTESRGFCTSYHSVYYFSVLAVIDLGALVYALYETYVARNLSTEFAESAYIAKALVVIMAVSFLGIPIAIIASDDPRSKFIALTGIIFAICMSLLLFIFVPKELYRRKPNSSKPMHSIVAANIGIKHSSDFNHHSHSGLKVIDTRLINADLLKKVEALETKVRALEEQDHQNQKSFIMEEDTGEVPESATQNQAASQDRPSDNGASMIPTIESCGSGEDERERPE